MKLQMWLNHIRNSIRVITLVIMFTAVVIATAAGFAHSYAGLFDWGSAHKLTGWKADTFPLLVDMFILVGELGLFLIALDGLKVRKSVTAWMDITIPSAVIAAGWGASLWFNIHHLRIATTDDQITFAIPPIAAMIGLMILLRTVHRYAAQLESASKVPAAGTGTDVVPTVVPEPEPVLAPEYVPARMAPVPITSWHITGTGIFRAGTQTRTIWPVPDVPAAPVALEPARTSDQKTVPALEPVNSVHTTNGNGVVSESETLPRWRAQQKALDALYGPEKVAETSKAVPIREATAVAASPTAAHSEPHIRADSTDERHAKGLKYVMEFHAVTGKLPAQRPLAAHLGMKNRDLAREILTHAKEMINDGQIPNDLSQATHATG